ncbi:protein N-terminal asparagine amidohydrolase-like [Acipenser ruthenus]|nr:protein N-terminal asparagine amidohydrolase-like [Acipenser ruthenus]
MDKTMRSLYDGKKKQMTIGPYDWFWDFVKNDDDTRDLTDGEIRRNFSTSPLVEKPEFSQTIKEQYKYLADNVILKSTTNQVLCYSLIPEGWVPS